MMLTASDQSYLQVDSQPATGNNIVPERYQFYDDDADDAEPYEPNFPEENPNSFMYECLQNGQRFDPFGTMYVDSYDQVGAAPISPLTFVPFTPGTPKRMDFVEYGQPPTFEDPDIFDQTNQFQQDQPPVIVSRLEYKACIPDQSLTDDDVNDYINDLSAGVPPLTSAGIGSLRKDLELLNGDIHDLLIELRAEYAKRENFLPLLVAAPTVSNPSTNDRRDGNRSEEEVSDNSIEKIVLTNEKVVTLASDLVTRLRQQPDYLIWTVANNSAIGNPTMMKAAFLALHRLLHPFSTDPSITTALLLQSVNYQLEIFSSNPISQRFKREDRTMVMNCLFIDNLEDALQWDALQAPLPMVPRVVNETVFSCFLRLYAIRRDCTCYYRTIWKPIWPSILTLLTSSINRQSSVMYQNVVTAADRILEFAFLESSLTSFPTIATSVCRAVTEIGTLETMMTTILYYFLMPNLIKILCADHDSMENEQSLRAHQVHQFANKYFEFDWWMSPDSPSSPQNSTSRNDLQAIDLLRSVLWMVWRLCVVSLYSTEEQVTAMTVEHLNMNRFDSWNTSYLNDDKLRKILIRSRRRLENAATWLMKLPVDISGTKYLSHDQNTFSIDVQDVDATALLEHRIAALQFKPLEMLSLSVISRAEISDLMTDVAYAMEDFQLHEQDGQFYHLIRTYLSYYAQEEPEDPKEELLLLRFLHKNNSKSEYVSPPGATGDSVLIQEEYRHISRGLYGLKLYRLALVLMIRKIQASGLSNIHELIGSQLFHLEADLQGTSCVLSSGGMQSGVRASVANRHTEGSRQKIRSPQHGLRAERKLKAFPLFSQHNVDNQDLHPNVKSLKAMQDEVTASYRFGSAQPGVDAGSSIARKRVQRPALQQQQVKVTLLNAQQDASLDTAPQTGSHMGGRGAGLNPKTGRKLRQYTTATIRVGTSLLAPTQASLHQQYGVNKKHPLHVPQQPQALSHSNAYLGHQAFAHVQGERYVDEENPHNKDKSFMTSMRSYSVIPTETFRQRHAQKRHARFFHQDIFSSDRSSGGEAASSSISSHRRAQFGGKRVEKLGASISSAANSGTTSSQHAPVPKPFPEHLRNRIRGFSPPQQHNLQHPYDDREHDAGVDERKVNENLSSKLSLLKNLLQNRTNISNFQEDEEVDEEADEDFDQQQSNFRNGSHGEYEDSLQQSASSTQQHVQHLLHSFRQQIQPLFNPSVQNGAQSPAGSLRQPSMPAPLPDAVHLMKPTRSFFEKLQQVPLLTNAQMRDYVAGIPPGLRDYSSAADGHMDDVFGDGAEFGGGDFQSRGGLSNSSTVQHPYPFRPNARDVNRPNDPNSIRSPKKPVFLSRKEIEAEGGGEAEALETSIWSSRSRSRSPSSRSRSRSRSRSPTSLASSTHSSHFDGGYTGSYAKSTLASSLAQAERADEIAQAARARQHELEKLTPVRMMMKTAASGAHSASGGHAVTTAAAFTVSNVNMHGSGSEYRRRLSSRLAGDKVPRNSTAPTIAANVNDQNSHMKKNDAQNSISEVDDENRPVNRSTRTLSMQEFPSVLPPPATSTVDNLYSAPNTANAGSHTAADGTAAAAAAAMPNTVPVKIPLTQAEKQERRIRHKQQKQQQKEKNLDRTPPQSRSQSPVTTQVLSGIERSAVANEDAMPASQMQQQAQHRPVKLQFAEAFQRASQEAAVSKISADSKYAINFHNSDDEHGDEPATSQQQQHSSSPKRKLMNPSTTVDLWADRLTGAGYQPELYVSPRRHRTQAQAVEGEMVENDDELRYLAYPQSSLNNETTQTAYSNTSGSFFEGGKNSHNTQPHVEKDQSQWDTAEDIMGTGAGGGGRIPLIRRRSSMTNQDESIKILTQGFGAVKVQ
jgi:hypothetical protein